MKTREGFLHRQMKTGIDDFLPIYSRKHGDEILLSADISLEKLSPNRGHPNQRTKVAIAWGNSFPIAHKHIMAIFNIFAHVKYFYNRSNDAVVSGIMLVLESMWTDDSALTKDGKFMIDCFIKNNAKILVSRHPDSIEKQSILTYCLNQEMEGVSSDNHPKWENVIIPLQFPTDSLGLSVPSDIAFRVFEYLLDYDS